jgi:hypothetical protein
MSDFNKLFDRATQIAKEEGLFRDDSSKRDKALPDPRDAEIDLASATRVIERLSREGPSHLPPVSAPPRVDEIPVTPKPNSDPVPISSPPDTEQELRVAIAKAEVIIKEQLDFLSKWADSNSDFAKKDRFRYWVLKVPALVSTVSVSALEAFGYGQTVILAGVIAAFCVGIDAAFPGGQLHNIHKRATNEIRRLQHDVLTKWRQAQLGPKEELVSAAQAILKDIQENRARIDTYVTEAEASLGKADSTDVHK